MIAGARRELPSNRLEPIQPAEFNSLVTFIRGKGLTLAAARSIVGSSASGRERGVVIDLVVGWIRTLPKAR